MKNILFTIIVLGFASTTVFADDKKSETKDSKATAHAKHEEPKPVEVKPLTPYLKEQLEKAQKSSAQISDENVKAVVTKYLDYIKTPNNKTASDFTTAMYEGAKSKKAKLKMDSGFFEGPQYAVLTTRWSTWIEAGDQNAINALYAYQATMALDDKDKATVTMQIGVVKSKFATRQDIAKSQCLAQLESAGMKANCSALEGK